MRRKQQGNTFLDISFRISFIYTPWGFLLSSVWTGATLRPKSEIFIFVFFLIISNHNVIIITNEILKVKPNMSPNGSTPTSFRDCFNWKTESSCKTLLHTLVQVFL